MSIITDTYGDAPFSEAGLGFLEGKFNPMMRLGNLYLLYAEALNESGATKTDVLTWVDLIRERADVYKRQS